jgi:hypothetical protein
LHPLLLCKAEITTPLPHSANLIVVESTKERNPGNPQIFRVAEPIE